MKLYRILSILFFVLGAFFLGGCESSGSYFGAKMYACYDNYDSAARMLRANMPEETTDCDPETGYFWMFLGFAEMHRGMIPEMHEAFAKSLHSGPRPELYLLRGEWYTRCGNVKAAEKDFNSLEALLKNNNYSNDYGYYRFLAILGSRQFHKSLWLKVRDHGFYQEFLKQRLIGGRWELEKLKDTPGQGIFCLRCFSSSEIHKISYGMSQKEILSLLGRPEQVRKLYNTMLSQIAWDYRLENKVLELRFSPTSKRLGDIYVANGCSKHGVAAMRPMKTKNYIGRKPYDSKFIYTKEHLRGTDFNLQCLECLKEKIGEPPEN